MYVRFGYLFHRYYQILQNPKKGWRFNLSPLFLKFLQGDLDFECTPWGSPAYNIFGWQKPCYLLQDGYVNTFKEYLELTDWDNYGNKSDNPKCQDCMVHCGFEPTAADDSMKPANIWRSVTTVLG